MRILLIITFLAGTFYSSCSQSIRVSKIDNKVDTSSVIIVDPIEEMPFVIERESIYSVMPDSLGKNITGSAGLRLYINEMGIIENFELVRLLLEKDSTRFIEFQRQNFGSFNLESYPGNVQKYYPFFKDYVNTLKIKRITAVESRSVIMYLLIRFK
jgi:hypothetical protein